MNRGHIRMELPNRLGGLLIVCLLVVSASVASNAQGGRNREQAIRAHMEMLAGDALQGRRSGTRDEWIAAEYVASQLRQWGIEPVDGADDLVHVVETSRIELTAPPMLRTGSVTFSHGREMLVRTIGAHDAAGPLVRYVPGVQVPAGAVVLVAGPELPPAPVIASSAAVLEPETAEARLEWDKRAAATEVTAATDRPWRVVLDAAAFLAMSRVADGATVHLEALSRPGRTWNVVGQITGRDRQRAGEVVMLSAHLDHVGVQGDGPDRIHNGADDNASGMTAVLEIGRALALEERPRRTVILAFFGSEETGGAGSSAFVETPLVALDRIVAALQFEMIGRPDPALPDETLWLTGFDRSTLGPELARRGARLVADPHPEQQFFYRSDNIRFAYRGVVAHTVSSFGLHDDYHRPGDDLSGIDFDHMVAAIESLIEPIAWFTNATFVPEWREGGQPEPGSRPSR